MSGRAIVKTIGVLGGLGPQATMDFEARVHAVAQRLIPPHGNSGYPPMVVVYLRHPPVVMTDDGAPVVPFEPDPRLLERAAQVGALADFLVVTSNAPHMFRSAIEDASGRPVLSMIDCVMDDVRRRGWRTIGVLGLGEPRVYLEPLARVGIAGETLASDDRARLDQAIFRLAEGREGPEERDTALATVANLRNRAVDGVILGCTEIPLLLGERADAPDPISPLQLLAEAAVRKAMA
jgi:aspartate racemase